MFSFELSEAVSGISGCTFSLEGIPKAGTVFASYGNKLETGVDFRFVGKFQIYLYFYYFQARVV